LGITYKIKEGDKMTIQEKEKKPTKILVWENLQLLALAGTIVGQVVVGASFLIAQSIWLAANILSLVRDFALHRPVADKVKNACLTALTVGLIGTYMLGWYGQCQ